MLAFKMIPQVSGSVLSHKHLLDVEKPSAEDAATLATRKIVSFFILSRKKLPSRALFRSALPRLRVLSAGAAAARRDRVGALLSAANVEKNPSSRQHDRAH